MDGWLEGWIVASLVVFHSQVTGDDFSAVKRLFGEFVVAKKGETKLVLFTPVIYWHQKKASL